MDRLLTWPELAQLIPYHRVHVNRLEHAGKFPLRLQLGAKRVVWRESEIRAWIDSRPRGPIPTERGD
jgi:prophage regulatory protein